MRKKTRGPAPAEKQKFPISQWKIHYKGCSAEDIRTGFLNNLEYTLSKDQYTLTGFDKYLSLSYTVTDSETALV